MLSIFHGRIDKTLINARKGNNYSKEMINEERICLLLQPESKYIDHITPDSGSIKDISEAIQKCFNSDVSSLDFDYLKALGGDETVVIIGSKNGVATQLVKVPGTPIQRFVRQIYANELPLRHLLKKLDKKTTGCFSFTGNIGMELQKCKSLSIDKNFQRFEAKSIEVNCNNLSTDQQY